MPQKMSGDDHSVSFGAVGSITNLLYGSIELGAFRRKLNDGISSEGLLSSTSLIWTLRPDAYYFINAIYRGYHSHSCQ